MSITFLVGASGSVTGFGVIQSIREQWGNRAGIVALDTNPAELTAASILADEFVRVPAVDHPEYSRALLDVVTGRPGRLIYIPIFDSEILAAARLADTGAAGGLEVLTAGTSAAVEACNDKLATFAALAAAGVPAAATTALALAQFCGPGVIKPRRGVASAVEWVDSNEQLTELRGRLAQHDYVIQERCRPPEVTVDVFVGRPHGPNAGVVKTLCRERLQVKAGVVTKARLFQEVDLVAFAPRIAMAIGLEGTFCFQALVAADGSWRIIDVNPRPGGGTRMSAALGNDFTAAGIADFLGHPAATFFNALDLPQFVVRQHADYVTSGARRGAPGEVASQR